MERAERDLSGCPTQARLLEQSLFLMDLKSGNLCISGSAVWCELIFWITCRAFPVGLPVGTEANKLSSVFPNLYLSCDGSASFTDHFLC